MNRSLALAALAATLAAPVIANAQTCTGDVAFSVGVARVGAAAAFANGSKTFGAEFAGGEPIGLFGSAYIGQVSYDDITGRSAVNGFSLGYSVGVSATGQFCPTVSYMNTAFPGVTSGATTINTSAYGVGVGGSYGMTRAVSSDVDLIPFIGGQFVHSSTVANAGGGASSEQGENYGLFSAGFGLVFGKSWTLRPRVALPVGRKGGNSVLRPSTEFGIAFSHTFWHMEP